MADAKKETHSPTAGSSISAHREAAKWIVASAAAVGALLVAGLEFADIGRLAALRDWLWVWFLAGLGATLVGLYYIYGVIEAGAAVMAGQSLSLSDLLVSELEAEQSAMKRGAELDESGRIPVASVAAEDPLLGRLYDARESLFRGTSARSPGGLHDLFLATHEGLRTLDRGAAAHVDGLAYQPDAEGRAELRRYLHHLESLEAGLIGYAAMIGSRGSYDTLRRRLRNSAGVVVVVIAIVAVASSHGVDVDDVAEPTAVVVYPVGTGGGDICFGEADGRSGWVMPGSWERPVVVMEPTIDCPAESASVDTDDYVLIPD
ncbi:MAG: hypothetical protein QNJ81_07375 [Acidimicrobiia bacterium]|nr:hypothetical protein [Acidimicrobiia bacterium]